MKFFLDTANVDDIRKYQDLGIVDGVTTNPTLLAREKDRGDFRDVLKEICSIVDGPVNGEVIGETHEVMFEEGMKLARLHENIVVKIPMTVEGMKTVHALHGEGIQTNVTLIFTANQALIAAKAGANYVSPFIGRLDDISQFGVEVIRDIVTIYGNYGIETECLAASLRSPTHVIDCASAGAHIATMPFKVLEQMFHHPLTDKGIAQFLKDWETMGAKISVSFARRAAGVLLAVLPLFPLVPVAAAGPLDRANDELTESRRTAVVRAAEIAGPSVVTVSVLRTQIVEGPAFPSEEFFNPFLRNFRRRYQQRVRGVGSGVIVDADGLVLTNFHVVQGAELIRVTLPDGREFEARILGTARLYDLVVLRLETGGDKVPVARFGDDEGLMIGEWVLAIGNPFGYLLDDPHPTVTCGVVSAVHRDILPERDSETLYKDLIQTDAAINPGNSGGALVNALGEVVGINTFIFSKSGGSHGIGFAIPFGTAIRVMEEVVNHGGVREVWIGVRIQEIPEALAESMELASLEGVIVASVDEGSPADRAGVRRGDVIRRIGRERIRGFEDARRALYGALAGDELEFVVERGGDTSSHVLRLVERK